MTNQACSPLADMDTERHVQEKKRLLQRMSRKHGSWNEHHPRYRLLEALRGFSSYAQRQQQELTRLQNLLGHVSHKQRRIIERHVHYSDIFTNITLFLNQDQALCDAIVRNALDFYQVSQQELDSHTKQAVAAGRLAEKTSVSQALKHFVRDWAASGAHERDAAFPCILHTLQDLFQGITTPTARLGIHILLPGAGLGRLGHEIANTLGFTVTNNEWSMYQNVAYRFLSRHSSSGGADAQHTIHPFVDSWSHHASRADMLRPVTFPETPVHPNSVLLVEGDFTTAFAGTGAGAGSFDAVVTHFFIDTARNLMAYFDTILHVLKPGGYWINFGPLLYGTAPFVQLSLDEIVAVAEAMGFEFIEVPPAASTWCGATLTVPGKPVRGREAVYGFDERALTKNAYQAQFWVARKRV